MGRTIWLVLASLFVGAVGCGQDPAGGGASASSATRPAAGAESRPAARGASSLPATLATRPATKPASQATTTSQPMAAQVRERVRRITELNMRLDSLYEATKYPEALLVIEELVQVAPEDGRNWYNLACLQSLTGRLDDAIASLEKSVDRGWAELRHMERDEDLKAIRLKPGYLRILARREEIQRDRAAAVLDAMKKRFGEGYVYETDHEHRMIFAANVDSKTLEEIRSNLITYAKAMSKGLFTHSFEQYVAVVVPKEGVLNMPNVGGYYNHAQKILLAKSIGMVLTHEFTHALQGADQEVLGQQHPIWIVEGLATLFESSEIRNGEAVPIPNNRLNMLQRFVANKQYVPLADFVKMDQRQYVQRAMVCYPEGRYLLMYLQDKGLLKKWYDAYIASYAQDRTGAQALEEVLGEDLAKIEADWTKWIKGLTPPPVRVAPGHAYVGVAVAPGIDGLKIVTVAPGSGAEAGGLKVGDLLLRIDGKRMADPEDLVLLVTEKEVGDEVKIDYRRDGKEQTADVSLKAMPAPPTRPAASQSSRPTRPATTSSTAPSTRPATGPSTSPATQPASGPATGPATAPASGPAQRRPPLRPATRPVRPYPTSRPISRLAAEPARAG